MRYCTQEELSWILAGAGSLLVFCTWGLAFWFGRIYGQSSVEAEPCHRKHRDE